MAASSVPLMIDETGVMEGGRSRMPHCSLKWEMFDNIGDKSDEYQDTSSRVEMGSPVLFGAI